MSPVVANKLGRQKYNNKSLPIKYKYRTIDFHDPI